MDPVALRPAEASDAGAVARIWSDGWKDGHEGHVPDELVRVRTAESFNERTAERLADTYVAAAGPEVAGFVVVVDDEVEQLYVDRDHRGTGAASILLTHGELVISASGFAQAWLAVATGNIRAQRFYARQGWTDAGSLDYPARTSSGDVLVPCRRFTKDLPRSEWPRRN